MLVERRLREMRAFMMAWDIRPSTANELLREIDAVLLLVEHTPSADCRCADCVAYDESSPL
jgi:hypothetical protein